MVSLIQMCPTSVGNQGTLINLRSLDLTQGFLPRAKDRLLVEMGRGDGRFIPPLGFGESQALVGRK